MEEGSRGPRDEPGEDAARSPAEPPDASEGVPLPMANPASLGSGGLPAFVTETAPVAPRRVARGVVVFDLDGTILDDVGLISHVAGDVLYRAFGTPPEEGRVHYLATTGMPFEAQLAQLYPDAPAAMRAQVARVFHERKVREAYAHAGPFPEIPGLLKRLDREGWTLVVSTGAERETAELLLEREGLRIWFEAVLGSGQGTKREHLREYRRRYPGVPVFLVGDSRFDMEAAGAIDGVVALARASQLHGWALAPDDLKRWGARWADYSLAGLSEALARWERAPLPWPARKRPARRSRGSSSARRRRPRAIRRGKGPGPRISGGR